MTARELARLIDKRATMELLPGVPFAVRIVDARMVYGREEVQVTADGRCLVCGEEQSANPAWGGTHRFGPVSHGPYQAAAWVSVDRVKVRGK